MMIRKYRESDWEQLWPVLEKVFRTGETYAYSPDISEKDAHKAWIELPQQTFVSADNDLILGSYYIKPNQPGLGSHVCNCGYIVAEEAQGKGLATKMCIHSQEEALKMGFKAMQYNLVVSTNKGAIYLWQKLGFSIVGILPKAFKSTSAGYIDALIMYKEL